MTSTASAATLPSGCGTCGKKQDLRRCSGCRVMFYCSTAHQATHRQSHKSACNAIKTRRVAMEQEEETLRNHPGDFMTPADPFRTGVGKFWLIYDTRDYMRARFGLVDVMTRVKTVESVQAQFDHCMDMLRLCRGDNMGIRQLVPALMLRLDKDQECYDFMVWWLLTCDDPKYDWGNPELPYLDTKNFDVFDEGVESGSFCGSFNLSHAVSVTLLKVKLILDMMALDYTTTTVGGKVPREILDLIQSYVIRSPITALNKQEFTDDRPWMAAVVAELEEQVDVLYRGIKKSNKHFWSALVNPGDYLTTRPDVYTSGTVEEMQLVLQWNYDAWVETPGAIGFIKSKIKEEVWQELYS